MPGEYLPPVVTQLTGDIGDLIRKVEEAKTAIKSLGGTNIKVGFDIDQASLVRAKAAAQAAFGTGVTVPVRFDVNTGGAVAGLLGARAGYGALGWLVGLAGRGVNLFGGVLPSMFGFIGAWHLLIEGVAEFAAVAIPALIATGGFAIAASDAVKNIYNQFSAIHTVMDATGKVIPPMTDAMEKLHQAVQPQVYSVLGDALTVMNNKAGEFTQVIKGTSDAVSYFAARATVALTSGGMSAFLKNAVSDFKGLGDVLSNIFGTIGAVLKNLPGYAQALLHVLVDVSGAIERMANSSVGQGIIHFGLAFHGAFIYLGLLGTAATRIIPMILGWVAKLADAAGLTAVRMGFSGVADALGGIAGGAEAAAAGPWGWIAIVAGTIGFLAYKVMTAKDATQQYTAAMQAALMSKSGGLAGFNQLVTDQTQTFGKLAQAQFSLARQTVGTADKQRTLTASIHDGIQPISASAQQVNDLTSRQKQLSDESNLYNYRLTALAQKYGGVKEASALLTQAGVKMSQMLDKSGQAWKIIQQMVSGVSQGYAAMAQRGGVLGADLYVITQQASDQYNAMQKLNQAWQTFIGTMSQFQGSAVTVIQTVRQMKADLDKAGTSFTGVNSRSLTLQSTWQSTFIPQMQNVIQGMKQAHDSAQVMANVIATALVNAVNHGALANKGMRQEIYAMARQADPNATNSISFLKSWVDRNAESFRKWTGQVQGTGAALGHLPKNEFLQVKLTGVGNWALSGGEGAGGTGIGSHIFQRRARGGRIPGFGGGDIRPILAEPGEAVVDKWRTRKYAGALAAMGVPGMASGGIIPDYRGGVGGEGPWAQHDYTASVNVMAGALAKSMQSSMAAAMGGGGGRSSAGGQYNRSMLEHLWQQAGGPGGGTALIAAAIALAESGGNPNARNPSGASGLWQILGQVYPGNIMNPFVNALNAVSKFDSARGFSPWVTYTTGAYRAYMDGGGYLQPGLNVITNNTGQRERVLAPGEHEVIEVNVYLDGKQLSTAIQRQARRYNRRVGPRGTDKWAKPA